MSKLQENLRAIEDALRVVGEGRKSVAFFHYRDSGSFHCVLTDATGHLSATAIGQTTADAYANAISKLQNAISEQKVREQVEAEVRARMERNAA